MRPSEGTRPLRCLTLLAVLVAVMVSPLGHSMGSEAKIALKRGVGRVWSGPFVDRASGTQCTRSNCWTYKLETEQPGLRLRVGVDHPDHHDSFTIQLETPSGKVAGTRRRGFLETPELVVSDPAIGTWTLRVIAEDVTKSGFDLRAILEDRAPGPAPGSIAAPNLRPEPGFDFSFTAPIGSNYVGGGAVPASLSCHADEVAEDQAIRCLRFSFGYQNAGDGPMDLRFDPLTDAASGITKVRQRIYVGDRTPGNYTDNAFDEKPAGTATYHKVHGHYHYDAVFQAQVYRITGPRGEMEPLGAAEKRGACAHDWVLVDFERFYQDTAGTADSGSDCSFGFTNPTWTRMRIGLSRGWADIYTAELSDNYVNFGLNSDGRYLVRVWADPDDLITETNERDNVAYSIIEIEGDQVRLVERARGVGPWARTKLLEGLGD